MKKLLKEPLLHFFAAGAVLFWLLSVASPPESPDRIVVDRTALLSFIQYRSKAFQPEVAAAILDDMDSPQRQRLIDDYIKEEALYREARSLELDQGDYVIRQRMVQKLEFMSQSASPLSEPDDAALAAFYDANKQDYLIQPGATFTHVFISRARNPETLSSNAETMLEELRNAGAAFEDATAYGDRFLFHTNYVERTFDYIKSHFGKDATDTIFAADTPLNTWVGPLVSEHGAHLVFVTARTAERVPPLVEISSRVAKDLQEAEKAAATKKLVDSIIDDYEPVILVDEIGADQ